MPYISNLLTTSPTMRVLFTEEQAIATRETLCAALSQGREVHALNEVIKNMSVVMEVLGNKRKRDERLAFAASLTDEERQIILDRRSREVADE